MQRLTLADAPTDAGWTYPLFHEASSGFRYVYCPFKERLIWESPLGERGEMGCCRRERGIVDIPGYWHHGECYERILAHYRDKARRAPSGIVDSACGTGYGSALLYCLAPTSRVLGVDLDPEAVAYAAARHGRDGVRFSVGDVRDLAMVGDDSVDLFVCVETWEHVPKADAPRIMETAARILRPGGMVGITTPVQRQKADWSPFHQHEYTTGEFGRMTRDWFRGQFVGGIETEGKPGGIQIAYLWRLD